MPTRHARPASMDIFSGEGRSTRMIVAVVAVFAALMVEALTGGSAIWFRIAVGVLTFLVVAGVGLGIARAVRT